MLALFITRFDPFRTSMVVRLPDGMRRVLTTCALTIVVGVIIASAFETIYVPGIAGPHFVWLTAFFFKTQDLFWLVSIALLLGFLAVSPLPIMASRILRFFIHRPSVWLIGLAAFVLIGGVFGTYIVFHGYQLSRDEVLAQFDAVILGSDRIVAPIAHVWRPFATALEPRFMLPAAQGEGFVSEYLPVNAGFRALVGSVADSNWTSPLLAALAVFATFGVARRLWPDRPGVALICATLVATSSQVLVTSMTSYAMTGHLALNMLWLWLFLRNDKIGHGGAIVTGFFATGLHQLIFHPLFVAPFIARLWRDDRRRLAAGYIFGYLAICILWVSYWKLGLTWQGIVPQGPDDTGFEHFLLRFLEFFVDFHWAGADLMLKDLLRLVAWQNPAVLPLAVLAYPAVRRGSGIAQDLFFGLLLIVVFLFFLVPYQGHGWGYRYLHGLIGNMALLAGYGWVALSERLTRGQIGACRTKFAVCTGVALLVLLPAHAKQAHDFTMPYVKAWNAIEHAPTDIVIVDKSRLLFVEDLVRNDPFLRNRPKVLDISFLTEADLAQICAHYSVSLFDYDQAVALGITPYARATEVRDSVRAQLRTAMSRLSCDLQPVVKIAGAEQVQN